MCGSASTKSHTVCDNPVAPGRLQRYTVCEMMEGELVVEKVLHRAEAGGVRALKMELAKAVPEEDGGGKALTTASTIGDAIAAATGMRVQGRTLLDAV